MYESTALTPAQLLLSAFNGAPLISGTKHIPLQVAQVITPGTWSSRRRQDKAQLSADEGDGEEDGAPALTPAARAPRSRRGRGQDVKPARPSAAANKKPVAITKKEGGPVQLADIVEAGILAPGQDNVSVTYKGVIYKASLLPDGTIKYKDQVFVAASAFSVFVKRKQTPSKQGDDGWKSVHVNGQPLEEWRRMYVQQQAEEGDVEEAAVEEGGGTDHWVQCSACETWRVVPDEDWPAVEADAQEDWFCRDAWWDVTKYEPHTKPCKKKGTAG